MKAEITYNAGKTYRIKGVKFEQGKTKIVANAAIIKKCQMTVGFCVRILDESKKAKKPAKPIVVEVEEEKPVKKKSKSRRVRQVVTEDTAKITKTTSKGKKDKDKSKGASD